MIDKRKLTAGLTLFVTVCCVVGMIIAETVESQNVVGFFKNTVPGTKRRLMAVPMHKMPVATGQIDGNTTSTITDDDASFGDYSWGATGHENGGSYFYLEITAGADEGRHWWITNNTATVLTMIGLDVSGGALAGQTYKIIPAHRIRDVFGEPGTPILDKGDSVADPNAGKIAFWSPGDDAWSSPIYMHQNGVGSETSKNDHWIFQGGIADDMPIDRDEGFLVTHTGATDTNFVATGEVSPNSQRVVIDTGARVFAGGLTVVDQALEDTGLSSAFGFTKGDSAADPNATTISKWNPDNDAWSSPVYMHQNGVGSETSKNDHWIFEGGIADSSYILEAGESYLISSPSSNLIWNRTSPLNP